MRATFVAIAFFILSAFGIWGAWQFLSASAIPAAATRPDKIASEPVPADSGELFVTGRLKDLIIIHGRNIYPQDIEQIVEKKQPTGVPNSVAAFSVWANGQERLCIVIEASRTLARSARLGDLPDDESQELLLLLTGIRHDIAASLNVRAEYFAFLPVGEFPRTSSGKVQRSVCKNALKNGSLSFLDLPGCITSIQEDFSETSVSETSTQQQ